MATRKKTPKTRSGSSGKKQTPATGAETPARLASTTPTAEMATAPQPTAVGTTPIGQTPLAIEVGTLPAEYRFYRMGKLVKSPPMNVDKTGGFTERLPPIKAEIIPRVVQQSVKPGTRVSKGTMVDLVLVPPTDIELGLVQGAHLSFEHRTVPQVAGIVDKARAILEKRATAAELTGNEREQLSAILIEAKVELNDERADLSMDAAYRTLQAAMAFS